MQSSPARTRARARNRPRSGSNASSATRSNRSSKPIASPVTVEKPKGGLDLTAYTPRTPSRKTTAGGRLYCNTQGGDDAAGEAKHPKVELRREVIDWIEALLKHEAKRYAGDPGHVPPRRLSNAEYDYTIRDLTGVDIRPTREFPVDPANEAGFDNSGESLTMSPALLKKYLEAARFVADHVVLKPDGIAFAGHPVVTDTDRDKYCVNRVIDFYRRQRTDYADYFLAAWQFQHRAALGKPNATLSEVAVERGVSPKYLATIWSTLTEVSEEVGPVAALQAMWKELPAPEKKQQDVAKPGCEAMRDFVVMLRKQLVPVVKNLTAPTIQNGSQCFVLWKNRQYVANRMKYSGGALQIKDAGLPPDSSAARVMTVPSTGRGREVRVDLQSLLRDLSDAFYVSERARVYLDPEKEKRLGGVC